MKLELWTKLEFVCFILAGLLSSCGSQGTQGLPGLGGTQGEQGIQGPVGDSGANGMACTVIKEDKKCYLKCSDGTWAYVGTN
jgi:hypothetical protein